MEGSSIRDTSFRKSIIFNSNNNSMNRSFISTPMVGDSINYQDDLRKSRIHNLPNYKKNNLSDNIHFIIIFQTIQIQRLSNEVEFLRINLKQSERKLFNFSNYQIQIRELTQKCFSQEKQRQQYRQQIDKLNKICQTLYHQNEMLKNKLNNIDITLKQKYQYERNKTIQLNQQIQKWKVRYQAIDKSKIKQLDDLKNLMQCQRKSMIDRQIREITIRFQNQRAGLENQIRKNRQALENRNRQIQNYIDKCQKYQIELMELKNYEQNVTEKEYKIQALNQKIIRINEMLRDNEEDKDRILQRQRQLIKQNKLQKDWQYENQQLKLALQNKNQQLKAQKIKISRLEDEIIRNKQQQHFHEEIKSKLNLASNELDRLSSVLRNKLEQIEGWKKKLIDKDIEISKYRMLENDIANWQSKAKNQQLENQRINGIVKSRLTEIQQWKNRYHNLEQKSSYYSIMENEKNNLEDKFNGKVKQIQQLQQQNNKLQTSVRNSKQMQDKVQDSERQNHYLTKEIDRLNGMLRSNGRQLQDYKTRLERMQGNLNQYRNIQSKVRQFENKIILLTQEIQKLNGLIKQKNLEIDNLEQQKLQNHRKMVEYRQYEQKMLQLEQVAKQSGNNLQNMRQEVGKWQKKYNDGENRASQLQNHLFKSTQEKQKLGNMIKNRNNEYEQLRQLLSRKEEEVRKNKSIQMHYEQLQSKFNSMCVDKQSSIKNMQIVERNLQQQRQLVNQFACKVIVLSSEVERLSDNSRGMINNKEYMILKENYEANQRKIKLQNGEIQLFINKINNLESKVSTLNGQFNRLLSQVERKQQESRQMLSRIDQYQNYAKRIHILGAEIDRLKEENKALDDDIRKIRLRYSEGINEEKQEQTLKIQKVLMAVQIQSLRNSLTSHDINVEQMRKSILEPVRRIQ